MSIQRELQFESIMATPKVSSPPASPISPKRTGFSESKATKEQTPQQAALSANTWKANFSERYNCPDPRPLFAALKPLRYQIPQQVLPLLERVLRLAAQSRQDGQSPKVLDVCCSYGINAALLRCQLDLETLYDHFIGSTVTSPGQLLLDDKAFFAHRARRSDLRVVGLDTAANAVNWAKGLGLLDDGWAENLEHCPPSPRLMKGLRDVGIVFCTGGVGYVTSVTFRHILQAVEAPEKLWIVAPVLRIFSYDAIKSVYDSFGLVTEKLDGVYLRQRRFVSPQEQSAAIADVVARGLDPMGLEADGWFYAEVYVTRPAEEAARMSMGAALEGLLCP